MQQSILAIDKSIIGDFDVQNTDRKLYFVAKRQVNDKRTWF